jgi:hypothetical protein
MRTSVKAAFIAAMLLFAFSLPSFASPPILSLTAPRKAHSGAPLFVTYAVTNPLSDPITLTVQYSITGPCLSKSGSETLTVAGAGQVGSVQTNTLSYSFPSGGCAGTYTLNVTVTYNGVVVSSVDRTFTVAGH